MHGSGTSLVHRPSEDWIGIRDLVPSEHAPRFQVIHRHGSVVAAGATPVRRFAGHWLAALRAVRQRVFHDDGKWFDERALAPFEEEVAGTIRCRLEHLAVTRGDAHVRPLDAETVALRRSHTPWVEHAVDGTAREQLGPAVVLVAADAISTGIHLFVRCE